MRRKTLMVVNKFGKIATTAEMARKEKLYDWTG